MLVRSRTEPALTATMTPLLPFPVIFSIPTRGVMTVAIRLIVALSTSAMIVSKPAPPSIVS
jgi:hypothetical protein